MADRPYETRTVTALVEYRDDGAAPTIEGHAATFNDPYTVGYFTETIHPDAFKRTLANGPDVRLLVDHEGQPLARTKSGTLTLGTDERGLTVRAELDPTDPDVQRLIPKMKRGDMDQMSFAFRVPAGGDSWDHSGDMPKRTIREANLSGGDVSVVTYPANEGADVALRKRESRDAHATLLHSYIEALREGRKVNETVLNRVFADLGSGLTLRTVGDSFSDTQQALRDALQKKFGGDDGDEPFDMWVQDAGPNWVVWCSYGDSGPGVGTWRMSYVLDGANVVLTGDPVQVTVETTYAPVQQNSTGWPVASLLGDLTVVAEDASADALDAAARAAMSTADINDLPDHDFAYIEDGGEKDDDGKTTPRTLRHFPINDEAHTRNALARMGDSPFGDKAKPAILAAAKKFGIDVSEHEENSAPGLPAQLAALLEEVRRMRRTA